MHDRHSNHRFNPAAAGVIATALLMAGCTGSTPPTPVPAEPAAATNNPATAPPANNSSAASGSADIGRARRQNERWTDANGVQYLGNVPLDVFFDQPYSVVQDSTQVGGVAAGMPVAEMGGTPATAEPEPPPAAASASSDWGEMIPLATLKEEVNSIRNFMDKSLRTVADYNSSMLMIPPKAAAMGALATIAMEHPEEITWKEDAKYIRDLAKQMNDSALQRGKKDQNRLLVLFENIADTLNRSKPAGLEEPPEDDSYADVAEMRLLMMRMEAAEKRMKNEAGSETAFETQKEMIRHEAAMLGTLAKVVTLEGYGYEEDEEFIGYAKRLIDATAAIRSATETNDFASYDQALSKISTGCTECHSAFKND